jgi:hypothetical protein
MNQSESRILIVRRWKIEDEVGTIVAGGIWQGRNLNQLTSPANIFLDEDYSLYVSDYDNHRVMKWIKGSSERIVVDGGNGQGNKCCSHKNNKRKSHSIWLGWIIKSKWRWKFILFNFLKMKKR